MIAAAASGRYFWARTPNARGFGVTFVNPASCSRLITPCVVRCTVRLSGSPM